MQPIDRLLEAILGSQVVAAAFTSVITALAAYLTVKLKRLSADEETRQNYNKELAESTKRAILRNEYLSIYNSQNFTVEQKWGMTRQIVKDYESLNGNHYIHLLEEELKTQLEKEGNNVK